MNTEQIFKLIDAGFTKDDIMRLAGEPEKSEPEPTAEPETTPEPEPTAEPEPAQQTPEPDILKFIADEFRKMTESIQQSNILNSNINQNNQDVSPEQMLADIIKPDEARKRKE